MIAGLRMMFLRNWRRAVQTARLAVGIPDYGTYLTHMRQNHPRCTAMDRDTFYRERVAARYGKGRSRCC